VRDVPSRLLERLLAGEIQAATLPSIDYARSATALDLVPGVAIACQGPVRSVRLVHAVPVEQIRRVALDASSHTSVALLKILLHERLGRDPEFVTRPPELPAMLEESDAALIIGDPALFAGDDRPSLDLGEEWIRLTRLPFVFAFWAAPHGALSGAEVARLQASLAAGTAAIPTIASSYNSPSMGGDGDRARWVAIFESYLRSNVSYRFGDEERHGLREFYRRAHARGLIERIPELRFHGDS
jgi:predicted solute-binding protein